MGHLKRAEAQDYKHTAGMEAAWAGEETGCSRTLQQDHSSSRETGAPRKA